MAINVYTGLMGSGKSYECVSSVIVPAVAQGRRVVTNISGVDNDLVRAYCAEKLSVPIDKCGLVVHVQNDDVSTPRFLPHGNDAETICLPGDLICIDEAWRFWGTDCKLLAEHKVFFREHRHYCHPVSGVSCDLVLMVQDIGDLHRILKVVVELTFRTTKLKSLGLNRSYRVEWWESYRLTRAKRIGVQNKVYDKSVFPLYSSYQAQSGSGTESQVDKRQNVLANRTLWVLMLGVVCLGGWGAWTVYRQFHPHSAAPSPTLSRSPALPVPGAPSFNVGAAPRTSVPSVSSRWRIAGFFSTGRQQFVLLASPSGRIRVADPSAFQLSGAAMVGAVGADSVYTWSGSLPPVSAQGASPSSPRPGALP